MQILAKDVEWKYSAPAIPAGHWIDRGFDEHYIEGMKRFLRTIKEITCELRRGACSGHIYLGDSRVLLHDDALLPHWQEFANAVQLYQNPEASRRFAIVNVQLSSAVMKMLTPALRDKPWFEGFGLNNIRNSGEGIAFAIDIIQSNQKLEQFFWGNNPIESMNDVNHLVEVVISHPRIYCINLNNCFGENVDVYSMLCSLLASGKQCSWIDLSSNNIRTGGRTELPDFLATNPPLCNLFLEKNHLDDNDAILVARALKRNTNLRRLRLGQNDITVIGRDALRNAVYDCTSLNAVAASNHTCNIEGLDFGNAPISYINSPEVNRGRKIYSLLSSRNRVGTNVRHLDAEFEDDSLKLVPKVLESVHICAGYVDPSASAVHPLSIMYVILRSWKMPALYENNGAS